jgi:hypothetical protein
MANVRLRKEDEIFLVGATAAEIVGSKLPSIRQVLSRVFYEIRHNKLKARDGATVTVNEVLKFWERARIPTRKKQKCVDKVIEVYNELRGLWKSKLKTSSIECMKREDFVNRLENLFDIAARDALQIIKIEEDRQFLISQRKPGREGCMIGVDHKLSMQEKRKSERDEKTERRRQKYFESVESQASSSKLN